MWMRCTAVWHLHGIKGVYTNVETEGAADEMNIDVVIATKVMTVDAKDGPTIYGRRPTIYGHKH